MVCDQRTDLKNLVVQKNTMLSASGLGNNRFECRGYQQVSTDVALVSRPSAYIAI